MIRENIREIAEKLQMERIAELLDAYDIHPEILQNPIDASYNLFLPVFGPMNQKAVFSVTLDSDDGTYMLRGYYKSDLTKDLIDQNWSLAYDASEESVVETIHGFLDTCFMKEHENMLKLEIINDDTIQVFSPILPDETLTTEGVYALGILLWDEDSYVPAGTISFVFTEDGVEVKDVFVLEPYRYMGIASYALRYVKDIVENS